MSPAWRRDTWTGEVAESVANPSRFPGAGEPTCAGAGELFHLISGKECFTFKLEARLRGAVGAGR